MKFTEEEKKAFRAIFAPEANDVQFEWFISECERRSLTPGNHVVFQTRSTKEKDAATGAWIWAKKPYMITTISALRLIAQRTGQFAGQGPEEYIYLDDNGDPSIISTIPLPQKGSTTVPREPWAVRVAVYRKDWSQPVYGLARFESVAGFQKTDNGMVLNSMWAKRGPEQCGKCALADGIRKGFSEETSSLYLEDEIKNELQPSPEVHQGTVAAALPEVPTVPKVDQTPAVPTNNPRPGETRLGPAVITTQEIEKSIGEQLNERREVSQELAKALPLIEKFATNPTVVEQLAAEGKKIDLDKVRELSGVSPDPVVSAPVGTAQVTVTSGGADLPTETKTVETPLPEPKKRGRKPKNSENGRPDLGTPNWESAEQMEEIAASPTTPEVSEEKKQEAVDFVESISTFTPEEAISEERPVAEDNVMPTPEQFKAFVDRMRSCTGNGVDIQTLGSYSFKFTGKEKAKLFSVNDWIRLLNTIEAAKADGSLPGVVKQ